MQPLSLGRVLLILLPGIPLPPRERKDEEGNLLGRCRSEELEDLGEPRERACHVTLVHAESCANVTVDLDGATDAQTAADRLVLERHGFDVRHGGLFASYTSASLVDGVPTSIGTMRYPPHVKPSHARDPLEKQLEAEFTKSERTLAESVQNKLREIDETRTSKGHRAPVASPESAPNEQRTPLE